MRVIGVVAVFLSLRNMLTPMSPELIKRLERTAAYRLHDVVWSCRLAFGGYFALSIR
jgi:hypothetical protein